MKYPNVLLSLSLCAIMFVPAVQAQSNNDYAPSQSSGGNPPPIAPPPGSEPTQQMNPGSGHGRHGGPRHGGGGGRGNGEMRAKIMQRFDADGDGVLSEAERAQAHAAREQMGRGRGGRHGGVQNFGNPSSGGNNFAGGPGGGGRHHGRHGGGGGGGGDDASKQERKMKMMKRFDANGDGTLDPSEQANLDAAKAERRRQREGMRGQDDQPMLHDPATNRQP